MKNVLRSILTIVFASIVFLVSCKNDDGSDAVVNTPPSQVTNINAEVITETARVLISWDASSDDQGDEIRYNVIINNNTMETKLSTTSVEVDVSSFLSIAGKQSLAAKGVEVTLEIEIKAYDTSDSFSNASVTKNLFINRSPTDFSFEDIVFNTDTYDELNVVWNPATDADGDTLTYTVYLNDMLLVERYEIPIGEEFGSLQYTEDFLALSDAPITVKIVVTDGSGEIKEISQSFDFKATDVDLGTLETFYEDEVQFNILETELDGQIGYSFILTDQISYSITNNVNAMMQIKDANNTILSANNILTGVLEPGRYELIVLGEAGLASSGSVTFDLTKFFPNDVQLGELTLPFTQDFSINETSPEQMQGISLVFTETIDLALEFDESQTGIAYTLYNEDGVQVTPPIRAEYRRYDQVYLWENLSEGAYRLVVVAEPDLTEPVVFTVEAGDFQASDQYLGVLENPEMIQFRYEETFDPDGEVRFYFTIDEPIGIFVGYFLGSTYAVDLVAADGTEYARTWQESIPAGDYYVRYAGYMLARTPSPSADFSIAVRHKNQTDQDLGVISSNLTVPGPVAEPDLKIAYTFKLETVNGAWLVAHSNNIMEIYDEQGVLVSSRRTFFIEDNTQSFTVVLSVEGLPRRNGGFGALSFVIRK